MDTVCWLRIAAESGPMLVIGPDSRDRALVEQVLVESSLALEDGWELVVPNFSVTATEFVLMHAVDYDPPMGPPLNPSGIATIGDRIPMSMVAGNYAVERRWLDVEDTLVLRLRPTWLGQEVVLRDD